MWKTRAVGLLALAVVVGWLSVASADDADQPVQTPALQVVPDDLAVPANPQAVDNEVPRRAAREFAPWLEAVIQEKSNVANRLFPLRRAAQDTVDSPASARIFRKFSKLDGLDLALVGGRSLGDQTGVLLFTITTEGGPIAFKIYHYRFNNTRSVGKIEITDDWAEIEKMYMTVDPLAAPVVVPL